MDEIRIGYFLEDIAQENFLKTLVERVADEGGIDPANLRHDIRNASGGRGKVQSELSHFLRDVRREQSRPYDLLVVSIDGNCQGYVGKHNEIQKLVDQSKYVGLVAYAIPDPHIERWYLTDPHALQQVLGDKVTANPPAYKCERMRYKSALRDTLRLADIIAPLGGVEYGADIAAYLDLYTVGKADTGFKHFVDEIRGGLARLR